MELRITIKENGGCFAFSWYENPQELQKINHTSLKGMCSLSFYYNSKI